MSGKTIVVGVNLKDAELWAKDHGIKGAVLTSPRSDNLRGWSADESVWTPSAEKEMRDALAWVRLHDELVVCCRRLPPTSP